MKRWTRHVTVVTLVVLVGFTLATVDDGGRGGGTFSTAAELDARLMAFAKAQDARRLAHELAVLHAAVEPFRDVGAALEAGYAPATNCMASALGAQGIHYANEALFAPEIELETPQLLMYEPRPDGSLQFVGVEYLVFQTAWHAAGFERRPSLYGQEFGLNEVLLDEPFYLLHVWIDRFNPAGVFADWNPLVNCAHAGVVAGVTGHAAADREHGEARRPRPADLVREQPQ
jgi:hypothetical protein